MLAAIAALGACVFPQTSPARATQSAPLLRMGDSLQTSGEAGLAVTFYQRAADMDPKNPEPFLKLGQLLLAQGQRSEALQAFNQAEMLRPSDLTMRRQLANGFLELGETGKASAILQQAVNEKPEPRLYNSLGVTQDLAGDHVAAQQSYAAGLLLAPGDLTLQNNLALSYALDKRFDEAIAAMQKVAGDAKATPQHRQNLALIHGLAGQDQTAANILRLDLDDAAVKRHLSFYKKLRALPDGKEIMAALRQQKSVIPDSEF
ncbi:MAG: tetratricopeptide repeat protein [Dongiaceae bacterium]